MMKKTSLTQKELRASLSYVKSTGLFIWKVSHRSRKKGDVAGYLGPRYTHIKLAQKQYPAHCLAWLYVTGAWPLYEVDHRDTDGHNNRWNNLREATRMQNAHNVKARANKLYSGLKGVTWAKRGKWQSNIRVGGVLKHLGYFDSAEKAHAAYSAAAKQYHGQFARSA